MDAVLVKCPHCFGEKPAAATVCLHCGRDEHGYGPMVRSDQMVMMPYNHAIKRQRMGSDLKIHLVVAVIAALSGFLLMLTSGLGALLFIFGVVLFSTTRFRMWWRQQRRRIPKS